MEVFRWIWDYLKIHKARWIIGFVLVLAGGALMMVFPYVSGVLVDNCIIGGKLELLPLYIAILIGGMFIRTIIRYAYLLIFEFISQSTVFRIRKDIYDKIQSLDFSFFDRTRTGDIMARMTGDIEAVRHFVAFVIYGVYENLLLLVFSLVVLLTMNVPLTLILLAIIPFTAYYTIKFAKTVKPAFSEIREQFSRLNSVVQENISGNRVVKAFAREDHEIEKFSEQNTEFKMKNVNAARIWRKYIPLLEAIAGMLSVTVILAGGIMVIGGSLTVGGLIAFNGYIWSLNGPMRMSGWLINDIQRFAASADKIMGLLATEPSIKSTINSTVKDPESDVGVKISGAVEFRNVGFTYGDGKVLENISIKVHPGQTVALIGPTGSGKTTLMNLIGRFYDCTEGEVLIDGCNVREYDLGTLRSNIGIAMQDIFLFSDTIEGNIAYGVPDAPMEDIGKAAGIAGASEFIDSFGEKYDTIIGERGVGLSGGQKQRIALARALLTDPSILILDDTTSSVDIETEKKIQSMLGTTIRSRTTFIIAHRISSVKDADRIYVLDRGRIVEEGSHKELISAGGYYYSVYRNQSGDFDDGGGEE